MTRITGPDAICAVEGCSQGVRAKGWCGKHYENARTHDGDPLARYQRTSGPGTLCSINGCDRQVVGLGWCGKHWQVAHAHNGDPLAIQSRTVYGEASAYFWAHVDDETDACQIWPYLTQNGGYGILWHENRMVRVSILACEHAHGPMPQSGMQAAHAPVICHNPFCFNPRHLRWATPAENNADMHIDGTSTIGERGSMAKLTESDVREIRKRYAKGGIAQKALAEEYGVQQMTISHIVRRKTWRHIQ